MLDRDELAARFAVAAYGDGREWNGTREDLAEYAVKQADALLAALASKPAATGAPAPEAKRPTHVRITNSASPSRFKDGDVLRVVKWIDEVPAVDVAGYDVSGYVLYDSKWAPAPCPPPVATGHGLPMRDLIASTIRDSLDWNGGYNACLACADAVLAVLPPSPATDAPVDPVREAERAVVEAAEALQAADDAYAELHATVKDDDDAHNEARPRLDQLHAARLNRRFDLTDAVRAMRTSRPVRP